MFTPLNFTNMTSRKEELIAKIKEHNQAYRQGNPIISDAEYDAEIDELKSIDPNNPWFQSIEPAPVSANRKVKLPVPMKSLNKVKDIKAIINWTQSIGLTEEDIIIITPKFDGLSLLHNETTNQAYSRGGAENEGQDCTSHYRNSTSITNVPTNLKYTFGEFVFSTDTWLRHFSGKHSPETGEVYKSPRNTAAGLLNREYPSENLKFVDFFRYGVDKESLYQFNTYSELYVYLCKTFKQKQLYYAMRVKDLNEHELISLYKEFRKLYYIDGLVLYANDLKIWEKTGRNQTTGNPNYAVAYKNPNFTDVFETTVKDITWKISKSGAMKPVVNIESVDTGDCNMENPTGYNAKWIVQNNIAKGAKILVTRSGGVIPKILETLTPADSFEIENRNLYLSKCPCCGKILSWDSTNTELCCTNELCPGIILAKIIFFFKILGSENLGEETINKLFNAGYNTINKILDITFEELIDIEGFGDVTANQILNTMSLIRDGVEVTYLMHASDCFSGIGQIKAKTILSAMTKEQRFAFYSGVFPTWESNEELQETDLYKNSSVTIKSFLNGILPFYNFIAENRLKILAMNEEPESKSNKLSGMKVCFTGVRDQELEKYIQSNGGEVVSGVSKKTTHLVVANINSDSSKAMKARQLGIPIMTIDEFKLKH